MDALAVFAVFLMHQLDTVVPLMAELVPAFVRASRQRDHDVRFLYPDGTDGRCFCRRRLQCDCLDAPMQYEREVMPSVPEEVFVASEAMLAFRLVNRWTRTTYREYMATHVGMKALVRRYRASALLMAGVYARESVVGMRVGCCVGRCSRCRGSLHECMCSVFSCECVVCVWIRHLMCAPPAEVPPDTDDYYRGDKPQRHSIRIPTALPPRDKRDDARMLAEYSRLRRRSFVEHLAAAASPEYDAGLDSDFEE